MSARRAVDEAAETPEADRYEKSLARRSALFKLLGASFALLVGVAGLAWEAYSVFGSSGARATTDDVIVVVDADGVARYDERRFTIEEADRLLHDVAVKHPGAGITACVPDGSTWTGKLAYLGMAKGVRVGFVKPDHSLCAQ